MTSNNTPTPEQIEEKKKQLMAQWEEFVGKKAAELGEDYSKKEFTFNNTEKVRLSQQETIRVFALEAINDILSFACLPRVGIEPNPSKKVFYDLVVGRFIVFVPKEDKESPKNEVPVGNSK